MAFFQFKNLWGEAFIDFDMACHMQCLGDALITANKISDYKSRVSAANRVLTAIIVLTASRVPTSRVLITSRSWTMNRVWTASRVSLSRVSAVYLGRQAAPVEARLADSLPHNHKTIPLCHSALMRYNH